MQLKIDFGDPILDHDQAAALTLEDLDDFYASATELDRLNLFFILLATLHYYEDTGDTKLAARISFLTAYYLFTPLTPPGSWPLSMHYIEKAICLDPQPVYQEWRDLMEKGN